MSTDRAISNGSQGSSFADPLQTSSRKPEPPTELVLCGEYDAANAQALRDELARTIDADVADLVLHLGNVTFLDASTLTVFIEARTLLDRDGRYFSLGTLSPAAARFIEICGLQCLLEGRAWTTVNSTGAPFDVQEMHLLTIRDGKVVGFEAHIDTPRCSR